MSEPIERWLDGIKPMRKMPWAEVETGLFLRDPIRRMIIHPSVFFSPADGVIVYREVVEPSAEIVPVKGQHYTLRDLLEKDIEQKCLVIGIFMTTYDVHVNRVPYAGMLKYRYLTPIVSANKEMNDAMWDILKQKLGDLFHDMGIYLRYNARMVNEIYSPELDYKYYVTQIADDEVNVITPFNVEQNHWYNQSERFSFVRWGSQVELVLPLDERYRFTPVVPMHHHVQAAIDPLVRIGQ